MRCGSGRSATRRGGRVRGANIRRRGHGGVRKGRPRPWGVRWITGPREHSEWYATKALANSRRSDLMQAMRQGEPFDVDSGLPLSEIRRLNSMSFLEFARTYIGMKWPSAAATTRGDLV